MPTVASPAFVATLPGAKPGLHHRLERGPQLCTEARPRNHSHVSKIGAQETLESGPTPQSSSKWVIFIFFS